MLERICGKKKHFYTVGFKVSTTTMEISLEVSQKDQAWKYHMTQLYHALVFVLKN